MFLFKKSIFSVVLFSVFSAVCLNAQVSTNELSYRLENEIDSELVSKHLYTLASDEMQGRKVGTEGIELAAKYIESEFEKLGLTTFQGAKGYRQNFIKSNMKLSNIIGVLEGSSKKEEWVVISAHYDHLGILKSVAGDSIANGADDDASGVAAVLTLANYFKKKNNNERTIVFIAFTGEEMGLWGSSYFGTQINPEKCMAGINIEMIGKDSKFGPNTAFLTGFERSDFGKIIQHNLKGTGYALYPDPYRTFNLFYRSDNASLARLGVPAHTFSTCPIDTDIYYHTVDDEVETLKVQTITNTIYAIAKGTESIISGKDTPTRVTLDIE
jgi:Zn-dependent M28 family amino/carboxypeptidase